MSSKKSSFEKKFKKHAEFMGYLFNPVTAPRGDGAQLEACKEFYESYKSLLQSLENSKEEAYKPIMEQYHLNDKSELRWTIVVTTENTLNEFGFDIETMELIS